MSRKPVVRQFSLETQRGTPEAHQPDLQNGERPHPDAEMTRVLSGLSPHAWLRQHRLEQAMNMWSLWPRLIATFDRIKRADCIVQSS